MTKYTKFTMPSNSNTYPVKKSKHKRPYTLESDDILTLDIEVSSAWRDNNDLIGYVPFKTEEFWNEKEAYSLPYIWQFSFNSEIYYGREFVDFCEILQKLNSQVHYIIYVHNLAYEFQFLSNFIKWKNVFARGAHKVIYAIPESYPNIEFRCSYFLTNLSLDTWGKELGIKKMVGDLDYTKLRTPLTPLTDTEINYCSRDCEIVYMGIKKYTLKYTHVKDIPLTHTGEVRRIIKKKLKNYNYYVADLQPKTWYEYHILKKAFSGGYTHANMMLAGRTLSTENGELSKQGGYARDFASSYPTCMCSEKYPCTRFEKSTFDPSKVDDIAYLMHISLKDVTPTTQNHYIQYAKCENAENVALDNGRIIRADYLEMWITEQDLSIITRSYKFKMRIINCYASKKDYLPSELIKYTLELYANKTKLKGIADKKEIYMNAKQYINALYGMMVTDILQDEWMFDGSEWFSNPKTKDEINDYLASIIEPKNIFKSYVAYQWGVWVTAYARRNLWDCILSDDGTGKKVDESTIYADTDSLKLTKFINFDWYDARVQNKLLTACDHYGIDPALIAPVGPNGNSYPLGNFAPDGEFSEFKTLGAKRYVYRDADDNELHLTISGVSKNAVYNLHNDIENFNENLVIDKDWYEDAKNFNKINNYDSTNKNFIHDGTKKLSLYINNGPIKWPDGYYSNYNIGIAMRNTSYSLSLTDEYYNYIIADDKKHLLNI